jgi:hypothetical protein
MSEEKIFADGFSFKRQENAPDFVIGRVSIKVDEAIAFLRKHEKNGWVNLNAKYGRSGNPYMELDTYEPKKQGGQAEPQASAPKSKKAPKEELPF